MYISYLFVLLFFPMAYGLRGAGLEARACIIACIIELRTGVYSVTCMSPTWPVLSGPRVHRASVCTQSSVLAAACDDGVKV